MDITIADIYSFLEYMELDTIEKIKYAEENKFMYAVIELKGKLKGIQAALGFIYLNGEIPKYDKLELGMDIEYEEQEKEEGKNE